MGLLNKLFGGRQPQEPEEPEAGSGASERLARLRERLEPEGLRTTSGPYEAEIPADGPVEAEPEPVYHEPQPEPRYSEPEPQPFHPAPPAETDHAAPAPRPVVLARKPRERGRDWSYDRSWFGGLPKLGGAAWPAGPDGKPLPFAAQIDLAELAAACLESPLPREGSLAFFLNAGSVVYVAPGDHSPTPAPAGLPPAYEEGGYPLPEQPSRLARPVFPFWPVEAIGLPLPEELRNIRDEERHEEIWQAQAELLAQRVPRRQYAFSVYSAREAGIASADRLWWYGAMHVLEQLRASLESVDSAVAMREQWIEQARGYQARLAQADEPNEEEIAKSRAGEAHHAEQIPEIRRQGEELAAFIEHVEAFTAGRDPWSPMSEEETAVLGDLMKHARDTFPELCRYRVPMKLDEVRDTCIRRMIAGEPEAFAALPDDMLAFVNERYRLTSQSPHQMFGLAGVQQTALYDHLDDLLLLQLGYDDMNEWRFGDMGLWHFWISPDDAAAGRWENAQLTFECG